MKEERYYSDVGGAKVLTEDNQVEPHTRAGWELVKIEGVDVKEGDQYVRKVGFVMVFPKQAAGAQSPLPSPPKPVITPTKPTILLASPFGIAEYAKLCDRCNQPIVLAKKDGSWKAFETDRATLHRCEKK